VSGSCWAINTYFTYGERSIEKMIEHFKARLSTSFTDPSAALPLFMERPTNKYLLRGLVERFKQGYTELGMVDIYGTLVSSRILIPANELAVDDDMLKLSNQRKFIDDGSEPLPIYTAVRHEIPVKAVTKGKTKKEEVKEVAEGIKDLGSTGREDGVKVASEHTKLQQRAREQSWFQWFELTPYIPLCTMELMVDITLAVKNLKRGFQPSD
jgi:phospholipase A2